MVINLGECGTNCHTYCCKPKCLGCLKPRYWDWRVTISKAFIAVPEWSDNPIWALGPPNPTADGPISLHRDSTHFSTDYASNGNIELVTMEIGVNPSAACPHEKDEWIHHGIKVTQEVMWWIHHVIKVIKEVTVDSRSILGLSMGTLPSMPLNVIWGLCYFPDILWIQLQEFTEGQWSVNPRGLSTETTGDQGCLHITKKTAHWEEYATKITMLIMLAIVKYIKILNLYGAFGMYSWRMGLSDLLCLMNRPDAQQCLAKAIELKLRSRTKGNG